MSYPEYIQDNDKRYKINTDFRIAIQCNSIIADETISDFERTLAVIYKLFGEEALCDYDNYETIIQKAFTYLCCGKDIRESNEEPDMDFEADMDYIEASFMSDYGIDLSNTKMHWWKFYNLLNGLSDSELGNCCVLNRIRNLRTYDTSKIKDSKEKNKIEKAQKQFSLNKNKNVPKLSEEQINNINEFYEQNGL